MKQRIIQHGATDSTSERAFAALTEGSAQHGDVHVAESQTAGRGRLGREWSSPSGGDLYASVILLPQPPGWSPAGLTMAAGLGVLRGLERLGAKDLSLKWPNDVVDSEGAKLAGVLIETRGLKQDAPHYVTGFGVNLSRTEFPPELLAERPVTSLALKGVDTDPERALEEILPELDAAIQQLEKTPNVLCSAFVQRAGLYGRVVEVKRLEETLRGHLVDLNLESGLSLISSEGALINIPLEHVSGVRSV
ncbi:MAG: biotin--[acetyl-CoA-carboxylase] ligase [Planctomycetota bacterium]|nr:biotin--[acetyl-CoA-carboxylase] ligase [Planctomycetota bacterium]